SVSLSLGSSPLLVVFPVHYTTHTAAAPARFLRGRKRAALQSRGAVRKRRREAGAFAVSRRQSALTTTKGACGAFPCVPIKIVSFLVLCSPGPRSGQGHAGALDRLGGLQSRAGASLLRPQPTPQDFG